MDDAKLLKNANGLFVKGKHLESISAFTKCIECDGNNELAFLSRGVAYIKVNKSEKAIYDFGTVIKLNNQNVRAYFYRGTAFMILNEFKRAIGDFDRTIELQPDCGAAFLARGAAFAQMGNGPEASKNINKAMISTKTWSRVFE